MLREGEHGYRETNGERNLFYHCDKLTAIVGFDSEVKRNDVEKDSGGKCGLKCGNLLVQEQAGGEGVGQTITINLTIYVKCQCSVSVQEVVCTLWSKMESKCIEVGYRCVGVKHGAPHCDRPAFNIHVFINSNHDTKCLSCPIQTIFYLPLPQSFTNPDLVARLAFT